MTAHAHSIPPSPFWNRLFPHSHAVRTAAAPQSRRRYPSVQHGFVALRAVRDDLLCLASSLPAENTGAEESSRRGHRAVTQKRPASDHHLLYRAVIEASSLNFGLKGVGEQEAILSGYAAFLNSLGYPVQLLTRVLPFDVAPYVTPYLARAGAVAGSAYQPLIEDHLRYVRNLATNRALLERRFYLVIPAENAPEGLIGTSRHGAELNASLSGTSATGMGVWPSGLRMLIPGARRAQRAGERQRDYAVVTQRLTLRADDVMRQLTRFGVEGRRLRTPELLALYADCLMPGAFVPMPSGLDEAAHTPLMVTPLAIHGVMDPPIGGRALIPENFQTTSADSDTSGGGYDGSVDGTSPEVGNDDARILRGTDGLLDRLAPAAVIIKRDALYVDNLLIRTLAVTGYPRSVLPGWLALLIDLDEPFDLSLHIHPLSSRAMVHQLTSRMVALHSSRLLDQRHGRLPDPEREVAYSDMERLRDALQRGDERVFSLALYLLVRAPTRKALEERCARLRATLDHLQLQCRPATLEHDLGFTSCLPEARDRLGRYRTFDTSGLATAFPFTASGLSMRTGILYGVTPDTGSLVILHPFAPELENANQVVFAKSGAGKSYACKIQALRALLLGERVCVVDPEDEYRRLAAAVGGQVIRLAPGSTQRINPFDLPQPLLASAENEDSAPERVVGDALADKIQALHALLDLLLADHTPAGTIGLSQREKGLLDRCLYETYRRVGITSDSHTHDQPAPLLRDLYDTLQSGACGVDSFGLAERLERYAHGSLAALFSAPTNVALDNPLVVFDVRDLDGELRPLGLLLIADFVWTRVRQARQPHLLVIDEAWSLMQYTEGGRFLAGLARRARKHYLGLITITQDVEDFLSSEWGRVVLANSSIQMLMKQDSTTIDAVSDAFHLSMGERHYLLACHKGEGLLFARGGHVQLRVEASQMEHALITTDPRELAQRATMDTDNDHREAPVEAMAPAREEPTFARGDDTDNEPEDESDQGVGDDNDEEESDLADDGVAPRGQDNLPRLRVIARAGQAISALAAPSAAGDAVRSGRTGRVGEEASPPDYMQDGANHHHSHHRAPHHRDDEEGDDGAE